MFIHLRNVPIPNCEPQMAPSPLVMLRAGSAGACADGPRCNNRGTSLLLIMQQGAQKRQNDSCARKGVVIPPCIEMTEHQMLGLPLLLAAPDALSWAVNSFGTQGHVSHS